MNNTNIKEKRDGFALSFSMFVLAVFYGILITITLVVEIPTTSLDIQWWVLAIVVAISHFIASVRVVREQEIAIAIFLGEITDEWDSGPHFALWPFFRVRRETRNSIQVDFGTVDEKNTGDVERAKRSEESPSWFVMKEPVRINWGDIKSPSIALNLSEAEKGAYANDPYANTLTTDPHLYFRFRIWSFKALIREVGGSKEAIERIKDTCVSVLSEIAGQTFAAQARGRIDQFSQMIREKVEDLVGDPQAVDRAKRRELLVPRSWGVDIEEVRIKDIGAPRRANEALAERAAAIAKADGEATAAIRTAVATRKRLEEEAAGKAEAVRLAAGAERARLELEGEGRSVALQTVANAVISPAGMAVAQMETLQKGFEAGKVVLFPADMSILTDVFKSLRR